MADIDLPGDGAPLPFACGGNMAVRRADWEEVGGFDRDLFAYFEDVDLGWRLWAVGREVAAAPAAVARHRGAQTSAGLGEFRRGVLFERNERMATRLVDLARDGKSRLVVVGAAHMLGDRGLPSLLARRGFTVEEVR